MNHKAHWDSIYSSVSPQQVGWYTPHLEPSLSWIGELDLEENEPIIDVGGGASTLVDDLIAAGHQDLTVLDLSGRAIQLTKERLGRAGQAVSWLEGDLAEADLPFQGYRVWHDRAVFHFMVEPDRQQAYKDQLLKAIQPGGFFILGTFGAGAPTHCSGLPVQRYTPQILNRTFGPEFELMRQQDVIHIMPSGIEQPYLFCLFQRSA